MWSIECNFFNIPSNKSDIKFLLITAIVLNPLGIQYQIHLSLWNNVAIIVYLLKLFWNGKGEMDSVKMLKDGSSLMATSTTCIHI